MPLPAVKWQQIKKHAESCYYLQNNWLRFVDNLHPPQLFII
jgi:hypothetical protein